MTGKFFNDKVSYDAEFDPRFAPRFAEIATFLRAPHRLDLGGVDIGIAGVPFDGGATNRVGARHGPRAVRDLSSLMRATHHVFRINPFDLCRIADVGDVRFHSLFDNATAEADIVAFYERFAAAGATPLSIGGDHSITYAILKGLVKDAPVGLVHIDAHTDTLGPIQGTRFHHGSPFRNAIEDGLLDPKRMVQIGIRGAHNVFEAWTFAPATAFASSSSKNSTRSARRARSKSRAPSSAMRRRTSPSTSTRSTPRSRPARARRKREG